jgi:hypothetical protein
MPDIEFPIYPNRVIAIWLQGQEYAWIGTQNKRTHELRVFGIIRRRRLKYLAKVLYEYFYGNERKENK